MLEYAALATAVALATKAIVAWTKDVATLLRTVSAARTDLMDARQKRRLAELLGALQTQRYSQASLPWLLRATARTRDMSNWTRVTEVLAEIQDHVVEVLDILQSETGKVAFECRDAFEAALFGMRDRQVLLRVLAQLRPPRSDSDFEAIEHLAAHYAYMIEQLRQADRVLAEYLTNGKASSTVPEGFQLFDMDDLLNNWDGKLLQPNVPNLPKSNE